MCLFQIERNHQIKEAVEKSSKFKVRVCADIITDASVCVCRHSQGRVRDWMGKQREDKTRQTKNHRTSHCIYTHTHSTTTSTSTQHNYDTFYIVCLSLCLLQLVHSITMIHFTFCVSLSVCLLQAQRDPQLQPQEREDHICQGQISQSSRT